MRQPSFTSNRGPAERGSGTCMYVRVSCVGLSVVPERRVVESSGLEASCE